MPVSHLPIFRLDRSTSTRLLPQPVMVTASSQRDGGISRPPRLRAPSASSPMMISNGLEPGCVSFLRQARNDRQKSLPAGKIAHHRSQNESG